VIIKAGTVRLLSKRESYFMAGNDKIQVSSYLSHEIIERKIYVIRGRKVMLDRDLSDLYQVSTRVLVQAVKRNLKRFPDDFVYQLTNKEVIDLRSQIVISSWGGRRYSPYAFTEQGIAMLSSVLKSGRAIEVNIQIMRTFIKLRELISQYRGLELKIEQLEKKYDQQFQVVFKAIKMLLDDKPKLDPGTGNRRFDI
jgi:hypothetical protein